MRILQEGRLQLFTTKSQGTQNPLSLGLLPSFFLGEILREGLGRFKVLVEKSVVILAVRRGVASAELRPFLIDRAAVVLAEIMADPGDVLVPLFLKWMKVTPEKMLIFFIKSSSSLVVRVLNKRGRPRQQRAGQTVHISCVVFFGIDTLSRKLLIK